MSYRQKIIPSKSISCIYNDEKVILENISIPSLWNERKCQHTTIEHLFCVRHMEMQITLFSFLEQHLDGLKQNIDISYYKS